MCWCYARSWLARIRGVPVELERLVVVEALSAKLIGGVLRVRCKPNTAVEFVNGREVVAMLINFTERPEVTEEPFPYDRMP